MTIDIEGSRVMFIACLVLMFSILVLVATMGNEAETPVIETEPNVVDTCQDGGQNGSE